MSFIKITQDNGIVRFVNTEKLIEILVLAKEVQVSFTQETFANDTYRGVVSITEVEQIHWQAKKEEPKPEQKEEQPEGEKILWEATLLYGLAYETQEHKSGMIDLNEGDIVFETQSGLYARTLNKTVKLIDNEYNRKWADPNFIKCKFTDYCNESI